MFTKDTLDNLERLIQNEEYSMFADPPENMKRCTVSKLIAVIDLMKREQQKYENKIGNTMKFMAKSYKQKNLIVGGYIHAQKEFESAMSDVHLEVLTALKIIYTSERKMDIEFSPRQFTGLVQNIKYINTHDLKALTHFNHFRNILVHSNTWTLMSQMQPFIFEDLNKTVKTVKKFLDGFYFDYSDKISSIKAQANNVLKEEFTRS